MLEPTSLDIVTVAGAALDQVLLDNVYETLLTLQRGRRDRAGPRRRCPEVSDDGTVYTFTLQDGVTFHSGEPMTSADVVWSLDAQRAEGANEAERLAGIASVEAPDDADRGRHAQPSRTTTSPTGMTRRAGAVLQADATGLENSANGTGPFTFVEWNVGSSITLARNDDYWGEAPAISGVTFLYFTDPNAAVNAFTTGDVDILTGVDTDLVGPLQDNPDYVVNEGTTNGEFTLGYEQRPRAVLQPGRAQGRAPGDRQGGLQGAAQRVRHADRRSGAADRPVVRGPHRRRARTTPTPPAPRSRRPATATGSTSRCCGRTSTRRPGPSTSPRSSPRSASTSTIEPVEFAVWLEQVFTNKDYDMTAVLHVEPRDIANYANPDYYWQYDNPEVQQLIGDAKVTTDPDEAVELLRQAARQISEDSPVDWLILGADLTVSTPTSPATRPTTPPRGSTHRGSPSADLTSRPRRAWRSHVALVTRKVSHR